MPASDPASGYLSKELINRMLVGARRHNKTITHLLVSPEDLADIREWTDADVDPATRGEIFQAAGLGKIWNIQLVEVNDLGLRGRYNINDNSCKYGLVKGDTSNKYNDYPITHGNIVSDGFYLEMPGETQIYGLCSGIKDSFEMRVVPYTAYLDITLLRRQKSGFFGWQEMGVMYLDAHNMLMGVIDRYSPDLKRAADKGPAKKEKTKVEKKEKVDKLSSNINRLTSIARKSPEKLEALLALLDD
jgi:hypothetical protein